MNSHSSQRALLNMHGSVCYAGILEAKIITLSEHDKKSKQNQTEDIVDFTNVTELMSSVLQNAALQAVIV